MTVGHPRRPFWVDLLVFFCVVLGLGGLYGGISFITNPSGGSMGMEVSMLRGFMNTYLPFGIFLLLAFGIAPLVLAWALIVRPRWFPGITRATGRDWAWVVTLALGAGPLVWMAGQFIIMGYQAPIQAFTTFLGMVQFASHALPGVESECFRLITSRPLAQESAMPAAVLILPGLGGSGPLHWQSIWEQSHPEFVRVEQRDWDNPLCEEWVAVIEEAVQRAGPDVVLVAHSLACLAVAH